jgi:hypothetical protein
MSRLFGKWRFPEKLGLNRELCLVDLTGAGLRNATRTQRRKTLGISIMQTLYLILTSLFFCSCAASKSYTESDRCVLIRQTIVNSSLQDFKLLRKAGNVDVNWNITEETLIGLEREYMNLYLFSVDSLAKLWPRQIVFDQINANNSYQWKRRDITSNQILVQKAPKDGKGFCTLTNPIFSINKQFAVIFYSKTYAPLFARGYIVLFVRLEDGTWKEILNQMAWMS